MASAKGHKLIVDMLLKAGASLSAINEVCYTLTC